MKIKKGDTVIIVAGKDKGKTGKVERVFSKTNRVIVEGINQYKRHIKARAQGQQSEIKTITKPLPVSNVAFLDAKTKKQTRIGYSITKGEKTRISKSTGGEI
jgi:large subunit ribosomal protein L24